MRLAAGDAARGSERDGILLSSLIRGPVSNPNYDVFHSFTAKLNENKLSARFGAPYKIKGPISGIRRPLSGLKRPMQDPARPIESLRGGLRKLSGRKTISFYFFFMRDDSRCHYDNEIMKNDHIMAMFNIFCYKKRLKKYPSFRD